MPREDDEGCSSYPFAEDAAATPSSQSGHEVPATTISEVETTALYALKRKLSNIPHDKKSALVHVQRIQPDLVDDEHIVRFIRAEDFDVELALQRLLRYWEHRYKVFGPDKFALPMTLRGAMKDNICFIKQGFITLLPVLDEDGRAILYSNSSVYKHHNPCSEIKIQVWWYLVHVAMENPSVSEKGFIILANSRESRLKHFDAKWALAACSSGDRDFPIQWQIAHVCHANAVFPFVASAVKAVLSPKQRKSFILHDGSNERVLESLSEYSLPEHCVPTDMGGTLNASTEDFVRERLRIEGGACDFDSDSEMDHLITQGAGSLSHGFDTRQGIDLEETASGRENHDLGSFAQPQGFMPRNHGSESENDTTKYAPSSIEQQCDTIMTNHSTNPPSISENNTKDPPAQNLPKSQQTDKNSGSNNGKKNKKIRAKKRKPDESKTHPGRTGDPRMNRAVQAKMEDPNLSLVAALVMGGFVFPEMNTPGVKVSAVKDEEGVTVYQRRNQLLRRLRLVKGKAKKS